MRMQFELNFKMLFMQLIYKLNLLLHVWGCNWESNSLTPGCKSNSLTVVLCEVSSKRSLSWHILQDDLATNRVKLYHVIQRITRHSRYRPKKKEKKKEIKAGLQVHVV